MSPDPRLAPPAWRPGASSGCPGCGGTGWQADLARCACVGSCPRCGGGGYVAGGLEACACRVADERVALLRAAALPVGEGPLPEAAAAWLARYRPEDGWPWLTVVVAEPGGVATGLARLVTGAGVPLARVGPDTPAALDGERGRLVACFGAEALGPARAAILVARCAEQGRTMVLTAAHAPFGEPGLERWVGEAASLALWERGEVVEGR